MPDELASEAVMPRNITRSSRKSWIWRSLSGWSGVSAQAKWLMISVMPWSGTLVRAGERRRFLDGESRAGSCRCRNAAPRRRASRWCVQNASHSASSARLPITGRTLSVGEGGGAAGGMPLSA